MQFWNTFNTLFDFLTLRIPSTTIFTSTCVQFGPGSLYRFVVAGVFFTFNNAQFFTVLFCSMRVLILYTLLNQDKLCRRLFFIWSILTYFLSFADSVGNIFGSVLCLQLDAPFQDGAMYTSTTFAFKNTFMNSLHFGFSTGIIIVIVITTALVVIKLRSAEMRKATSRSLHRTKAETVLTVTTILIIIPLFFAQGLTLCRRLFLYWSVGSYILSFVDAFPIVLHPIICLQLNLPFQDGAIAFSSAFMFGNNFMNMLHFTFAAIVIIAIVFLTVLVILKLRSEEMKKATSKSISKTKAETSLTVTMVLIIIPSFLAQGLTVASLAKSPYYSYILSVRPLMLDLRVNVVSIYFYFTHPIFKKKSTSAFSSTMVKSMASSTLS